MTRAIKPKSSHLHRLVGVDGGVGTNTGGGVMSGDCAGAKEPLPGTPPEVACLPGVGAGYDCKGGRGVLFAVEYWGGSELPELPPIDTGVVFCPPVDDGANDEPDWAIEAGGGVEVFTISGAGEEGVALVID